MSIDKSLLTGSTAMLILKLLDGRDMYGYEMIEELSRRSEKAFELKTGTLYPLLHTLEEKGMIDSYEREENTQRPRRYYHLLPRGEKLLEEKTAEWRVYSRAVGRVMGGGEALEGA